MRIAITFIDDKADHKNFVNRTLYAADLVLVSKTDDLQKGNWVVEKDILKPALRGTELVGGDTVAHAAQLAILEKLGLHVRV